MRWLAGFAGFIAIGALMVGFAWFTVFGWHWPAL